LNITMVATNRPIRAVAPITLQISAPRSRGTGPGQLRVADAPEGLRHAFQAQVGRCGENGSEQGGGIGMQTTGAQIARLSEDEFGTL